jgi:hypothetical protein
MPELRKVHERSEIRDIGIFNAGIDMPWTIQRSVFSASYTTCKVKVSNIQILQKSQTAMD